MATKNIYEDMSVLDALKYVKNRNMLLPDIQRDIVLTGFKEEDWRKAL